MQYRPYRPLLFQLFHGQTLKQFLFPLEICLQSGYEQALAESSPTAEELIPTPGHQFVDKLRLVYVEISVLAEALEILYSYRVFHAVSSFLQTYGKFFKSYLGRTAGYLCKLIKPIEKVFIILRLD